MKSKKLFLSITINIVLINALSISLYCTIKQRNVIRTAIEIIEEMTKKQKKTLLMIFNILKCRNLSLKKR